MNNVEIEDFYHHDFTTATEWEVFIARLEEIMNEWKMSDKRNGPPLKFGDFVNYDWEMKEEKLHFADVQFSFIHYKLKIESDENTESSLENEDDGKTECQKDILNPANDFVSLEKKHLEIVSFFGIREFLVLVPEEKHAIINETLMKILLSSITIAVNNINSEVPIFVQVQELWQNMYLGTCVGRDSCVNFEMVHLKRVPHHCKYLTGLLAVFKEKITEGCGVRLDPVAVSVRFSYVVRDWSSKLIAQQSQDFDLISGEQLEIPDLGKLPFGANWGPVWELYLFTTWPQMSECVVVDSEGFTDLEPLLAPEWSIQANILPSQSGLLGNSLKKFLSFCSSQRTLVDLLGEGAMFFNDDDQGLSSAFNVLSESKIPTISSFIGKDNTRQPKKVEGPIPEEVMQPILHYLFPDYEENHGGTNSDMSTYYDEDQWKGVKTCPMDSLVWRLAIAAAHCTHNLRRPEAALAQLWHRFIMSIKFRLDSGILIPGIIPGFPDSVRTCLLHQKLQMLNCCIERKKAREGAANKFQNVEEFKDFETEESEEEEFFECTSEAPTNDNNTTAKSQIKTKHLLWNKPAGRLSKHPTLRLLQTGDPLYLPVTQEPVPKTEDQLEEDERIMIQLGTDKYASEMRTRMMSASLLSDMESFKAANPGAILEDFIRWCSPRDWIEDAGTNEWDQQNGHLSPRMLIPDNAWSTTWASAQPVPAHRQKRLFDDTREAEKVLQFLISRRIKHIAQLLLPALTHAAYHTLELQGEDLPNVPTIMQDILSKLQLATKPLHQNLQLYNEIIRSVESVENLVAIFHSLKMELGGGNNSADFRKFLIRLMEQKEVPIPGGARGDIGGRLIKMIQEAQKSDFTTTSTSHDVDAAGDNKAKSFPKPEEKEFVLRAITPRPSAASTPQPQRMYACLSEDSIRLAGSFSEDTVFF